MSKQRVVVRTGVCMYIFNSRNSYFPILNLYSFEIETSRLFFFLFSFSSFNARVNEAGSSPPPCTEQWLFFPPACDYESLHNILSTALTDRRKTKGRERLDFVYLFFQPLRVYFVRSKAVRGWTTKESMGLKIMNGRFLSPTPLRKMWFTSSFNFVFMI